jgi:hypothetical protein
MSDLLGFGADAIRCNLVVQGKADSVEKSVLKEKSMDLIMMLVSTTNGWPMR